MCIAAVDGSGIVAAAVQYRSELTLEHWLYMTELADKEVVVGFVRYQACK